MQRSKNSQQLARIRVVGVGSGGRTAVNHLLSSNIFGVDFLTIDTDVDALRESNAPLQVRLGDEAILRQGAAGIPERGQRAALSSIEVIRAALHGSDLVFIIAGLGGGTGTGAAPIIAQVAKENDTLVIGIVTYPFSFEGQERVSTANKGISWLKKWTDTLIVIPNDRLLNIANGSIGFHETYRLANGVWVQSVQGVSELLGSSGLINVDFADVRSIMAEGGGAIIASGQHQGKDRAIKAAEQATRSELLGLTIDGAHGLLLNVCGGPDLSLLEVERAADTITSRAHPQANVIFGAAINHALKDEVRITVIATGFHFGTKEQKKNGSPFRRARPARPGEPWQLESAPFSHVADQPRD